MIASKHYAMLEHGTVYLKVPISEVTNSNEESEWDILRNNPYTKTTCDSNFYYYSANYRVIIEHGLQGVLEYLCEPTEHHEKRVTVKFTTSNSIMREFTRHKDFCVA